MIKLLPHQKAFLENPKKEIMMSGGYGSAKTVSLCLKAVFLSLRYPRNRGFLGRKHLKKLKATTLKTLLQGDGDFPPILPRSFIQYHNKNEGLIVLKNGSEILYGNVDIGFLKSTNLGWFGVDEATEISEEEWKAGVGRLRLGSIPVTQAFGVTNPSNQSHWIFKYFAKEYSEDGKVLSVQNPSKMDFYTVKTTDNIYLPKDYIETLKRTLFGHYYKRFFQGLWSGGGRVIFENFDRDIHVIDDFEVPRNWLRIRAIDFGYITPFVCLWLAVAGDDAKKYGLEKGDVVVYREYYYSGRIISINAQKIIQYSKYSDGSPEKIEYTVSDWDSGDRAELEAAGIRTRKAVKDISSGIQKISEYLGNREVSLGFSARPRLYFFKNALVEVDYKLRINPETGERENNPICTAEEMMTWSWKYDKSGNISETPEDKNNHGIDALRYALKSLEQNSEWKNIAFLKLGS